MTHPETQPVAHSAAALRRRFGAAPSAALVLGSGLSSVVERMQSVRRCRYPDLGLPGSAVVGHAGEAVCGELGGRRVAVMSGRVHLYEGYSGGEVVRGVRALQAWGVGTLLLTCSAGGIAPSLAPGELMALTDHLNFQHTNPLVGANYPAGERFPDMSEAYHPEVRAVLHAAAAEVGRPLHEGIYAAMMGPAYETPAEIRMLERLGADAVGMSTAPEALAAVQCGLRVGAIAVISNRAAGLGDGPLSHDDVKVAAGGAANALVSLLEVAVARL